MPRRAVIDIGTNSVKLLVADVSGLVVEPVLEKAEQTRLGQGFYQDHRLLPEPVARTAGAVAAFARDALSAGAGTIRVIATSAARDAKNPEDLLRAVHAASGLAVEVVTGDQEAEWAFRGVLADPGLAGRPLLILDVGGGSTEFIFGNGARQEFRHSIALGTVGLLEHLKPSDPPRPLELGHCLARILHALIDHVAADLLAVLAPWNSQAIGLVGTGGTATIMGAMDLELTAFDRARIEGVLFTASKVNDLLHRLWSMPIEARRKLPGLPPERADVILMGVAVYHAVMSLFGLPELRVSTRGMRFAALIDQAPSD